MRGRSASANRGEERAPATTETTDARKRLQAQAEHCPFAPQRSGQTAERGETGDEALATFPRWSLLAGEVEETTRDVVVRLEIPGIDKDNCRITIEGNKLYLSGEKHVERDTGDSTYHVKERAYGAFQRAFSLPRNVDIDKAEAHYRNGVLTVRLPKTGEDISRSIPVS